MNHNSKILIVDDEPFGRQLLEAVFLSKDYELEFANNGKEALNAVLSNAPDLILMDVMMPDMDGFEVCKEIRSNEDLKSIPIILITALDDRDSRKKGLEAGANDYISKPFDRIEIIAKVQNLLQLSIAGSSSPKPTVKEPGPAFPDEMSYFINLISESQKPLKSYILRFVQDYFQISIDKNDSDNNVFWFANYENKLIMLLIESKISSINDKLIKILITVFLNRIIQSGQFQSAADLITQLNNSLSEEIPLPYHASFQKTSIGLSLAMIDKESGEIQFSGFNQSILFLTDVLLKKIDLDKINEFPKVGNQFNCFTYTISNKSTIYLLNNPALEYFEKTDYLKNEYTPLKEYFSGLISLTLNEQEASFRKLFENTTQVLGEIRGIELIGIRI